MNHHCISLFFSKIFTTPLSASTSTRSPSSKIFVAIFVPMIDGMWSSREIIAACEIIHPSSVIMAHAFLHAKIISGPVDHDTSICPCVICSISFVKSVSTLKAIFFTLPIYLHLFPVFPLIIEVFLSMFSNCLYILFASSPIISCQLLNFPLITQFFLSGTSISLFSRMSNISV